MKIRRIEPIAVSLPLRKPVHMAGVELRTAENALVRIEADDGTTGWGEAAAAPTMTGETVEGMLAAVHHLAPALIGRPADDIAGALAAMRMRMYGNNAAKAAIEIALHDLVGRATGTPVHALLGGKRRDCIALLGVISNGEVDADLRDAERLQADNFEAFKIKVGVARPLADAERTRQLCAFIGGGVLISSDANQGWSTEEAVSYARGVAGSGLDFFEQPVLAEDICGMAAVAAAADCAIGADEGIHGLDDIRRHHAGKAARGVSLKAIKLGGLRGVRAAGELCEELGMAVNVACKTGESSIACAAALHVAAALPRLDWALSLTAAGLADDLTGEPVRGTRGHVEVGDRPGLGIEVDEERVRRYRRDVRIGEPA
ncbi:MAG TPA: enolase C-terminal domain-like protein [Xanthobacteraceae bacterium]